MGSTPESKLERIAWEMYTALRNVQQAIYLGEDEDDQEIEGALQAWERRGLD